MGSWLSRLGRPVGSKPYYSSVERSLERLRAETDALKAQCLERRRRRDKISSTMVRYSAGIFALAFTFAVWVSKQPAHTFSVRGHFLRVLPVFAWPPLAWLLHGAATWLTGWQARRDGSHLESLQTRREAMLSDLKDSTHFDRTQAILRKYDPTYSAAQDKERSMAAAQLKGRPMRIVAGESTALTSPSRSALVGRSLLGAGRGLMPALDYLAAAVVGDNPVLTACLQEARDEAEGLRLRLAQAEGRAAQLQREVAGLRCRLGEEPAKQLALEPGPAPDPGAPASAAAPAVHPQTRAPGSGGEEEHSEGDLLGGQSNISITGSNLVSTAEDKDSTELGLLGVHGKGPIPCTLYTADLPSCSAAVHVEEQAPQIRRDGSHSINAAAAAEKLGVRVEDTADGGSSSTVAYMEKEASAER